VVVGGREGTSSSVGQEHIIYLGHKVCSV
jgi:hypothetical protein